MNQIPNIEEWEEPLMHIMESYIMTAELGHLAKDQVKHKQELRAYYAELVDFIHHQLQKARDDIKRDFNYIHYNLRNAIRNERDGLNVKGHEGDVDKWLAELAKATHSELDQDKV